ncbi:ATPase, AAA family protein [Toxoplasma gondii TgCatPRC2]|uniref:ATPase, AAA family domain-containing protein n=14 Tax=Toxoplasma gondii TaxID=5811 RepID=B6KM09_TOXGV|nr:ATPase, AAA family protein [Toxoplasma gondii ME49]ESS30876.1 ATPase, AAA family protein [Toxoplasma gondii VEG]KFG37475.1 ATPase, AAA family protein [Toxoplasma gondii p89]KFG37571.1 ATPase, AAA family protein [Toxoplasma gondii FOU]KFG45986.1 ATPase, AAA family protein [Toxoplasma gondii GAB2-2007-GAL-DOM2]KFG99663.1 ATPase, AAA family protein [Toxoplasma gondii VAND]KYK71574.1 ATPase, AAA family protein [Toxoplasma gondii TgCatPRC2]PIM03667.1 ATPase, AAA family protein [Toxoplasma gond|eukprot:XP_002368882.1 ATPase, AAA family protein [Toxoplasma gondii ME49]
MFFPSVGGSGAAGAAPTLTSQKVNLPGKDDDITGKFDPTALERGAKALKELDSSPNAAKAFEVTKLQEQTKQKQLQKEMEELATVRARAQAEHARAEAEERRKTINHAQEQERVTAQYRAQLEAEAYQKKLQDQQKQNEVWLEQQHQQFLRQQELRKRQEQELLEMRRQQMREEKALEREVMRERIQEETKGRIKQERENVDIHLREMRAKAAEFRKTRLETLQTVFSGVGNAFNELMSDRSRLATLVGSLSLLACGVYGARTGAHLAGKYWESRLGKPPLVRETSRWVFSKSFFSPLRFLRGKPKKDFQEKIVLEEELAERLQWTTNSLIASKANGTPFRHMLLYGAPGTGKTLFARTLARESGMDYAIMTGGDVGPLGMDAPNEINKLFSWANKSRKGLLLFIDEADAFLRQGRGTARGMSEDMRNALSAFLHHTGTENDKFCVILATNCREILDRAVLDRVDEQFEFPLPAVEERKRMLKQFLDEYIHRTTPTGRKIVVDENIDDAFVCEMAEKTEGFSGRQLAKLVIAFQAAVFGSGTNTLTRGMAETVLSWKLAHFDQDIDTVERRSREQKLSGAQTEASTQI